MARNRDRSKDQHGERQQNYRADERSRDRDEIGNQPGLPEAVVGQSGNQPTGQGQPDFGDMDKPGTDMGTWEQEGGRLGREQERDEGSRSERGRDRLQRELERGGVGRDERGLDREQPAGMDIGSRDEERGSLNRDQQGERDTEIRRETQFQNATATPLNEDARKPKIKPDNDLFRHEGEA